MSITNLFHLEQQLITTPDGGYANRVSGEVYTDLVDAARALYPQNMLTDNSKLYIVVYGRILTCRTRKFKSISLEEFLDDGNVCKDGTTVVSFSLRDFDELSSLINSERTLWGTSERIVEGVHYRVHTYTGRTRHMPTKLHFK